MLYATRKPSPSNSPERRRRYPPPGLDDSRTPPVFSRTSPPRHLAASHAPGVHRALTATRQHHGACRRRRRRRRHVHALLPPSPSGHPLQPPHVARSRRLPAPTLCAQALTHLLSNLLPHLALPHHLAPRARRLTFALPGSGWLASMYRPLHARLGANTRMAWASPAWPTDRGHGCSNAHGTQTALLAVRLAVSGAP